MDLERKGQSPFYPGQPVPADLFVGRRSEVARITRAAEQVAGGKPQAIFVAGEYGIGKSSLARFVRRLLEAEPGLIGFHVMLGDAACVDDLAVRTVQAVVEGSGEMHSVAGAIRALLADYIGEQSLFGFKLHLEKLRRDAPDISRGYLPFLRTLRERVGRKYRGILLVFDEINGLAGQSGFSRFLKNLVDQNALSDAPLPLLLVLCGTEERRRELIARHQPVERIFEVAQIDTMANEEMAEFFARAFDRAGMTVDSGATRLLCHYSGGLPKLMHLVGDAAFWIAPERNVTEEVAGSAIVAAAEDVGRKFVDQQVYRAIRSSAYRSILGKLAKHDFDLAFSKESVQKGLNQEERKKFNNFLQRMKTLNVLASGERRGDYVFRDRLTRLYMRMEAMKRGPGVDK